MRVYKYISETYLSSFVDKGEILFRSLSYFQNHEEDAVRGDPHEGTRVFRPPGGLIVTKPRTGESFPLHMAFESTAQTDDIFVFCASTRMDLALAESFGTNACVEIQDPSILALRLRNVLSRGRRGKWAKTLLHGPVNYYEASSPPIVDWALPDKVAFSKAASYSWQSEYRFAFATNEAFRVHGTQLRLTQKLREAERRGVEFPNLLLRAGDIGSVCKVHRFKLRNAA